jgi:hypothetical protein
MSDSKPTEQTWRRIQPRIPHRAAAIKTLLERALGEHDQSARAE